MCLCVLFDEALHSCLMQSLVKCWVFCVHIDLSIGKLEAFGRLLVKDDVERDQLLFFLGEEGVLLHRLPGGPPSRVLLHRIA